MVESKKAQTVESILQILPPWEQHLLALLYEQQEMRKALGQLRDHFVQRLKEIQVSVKKGLVRPFIFSGQRALQSEHFFTCIVLLYH